MATILIVDDEFSCRAPLATLLEREGYQIVQAANGFEGLQKLKASAVNLIMLDLLMPGVDGVTMLQAIRKNEKTRNIPVILVTAFHDPRTHARVRSIGYQEYIFKGDVPFSTLLGMVKKHLGEHHVPKRRGRKPKVRPELAQQGNPPARPRTVIPALAERLRSLKLDYLLEEAVED